MVEDREIWAASFYCHAITLEEDEISKWVLGIQGEINHLSTLKIVGRNT